MTGAQWIIEYSRKARKQIDELSSKDKLRVRHAIAELEQADNLTTVPGVKHLKGSNPKQWRQRQRDYRIIFELVSAKIVRVGIEFKGTLLIKSVSLHHTGY